MSKQSTGRKIPTPRPAGPGVRWPRSRVPRQDIGTVGHLWLVSYMVILRGAVAIICGQPRLRGGESINASRSIGGRICLSSGPKRQMRHGAPGWQNTPPSPVPPPRSGSPQPASAPRVLARGRGAAWDQRKECASPQVDNARHLVAVRARFCHRRCCLRFELL
jgi:hypothetical protein